ncbi:MAG: ACT domain-containing protein [Oscillospiraceae bacterium]|nr:ACT domain-containing protein [Oscillospiraceae bacterium]MBQ4487158.1 ACT domain-containing protein [Oscillospiraceae bacterium]MCR5805714.1 ACT domain-containing protein [Oscillospiraceae bacterium]
MKQLTVFIENRIGRLEEVTNILTKNNINIVSISLSDTGEYGMLRMLVSQPAEACRALSDAGFSAMLSDVVAVKLIHHFGMLNKLTNTISENGIDIKYMYALNSGENASIVLKTSDDERCKELLKSTGDYEVLRAVDVYNM